MRAFVAPPFIRAIALTAVALVAGVVTFTAAAGLVDGLAVPAAAAVLVGAAMFLWLRQQPIERAASRAPHPARAAFLVGTLLVAAQLFWLVPFIVDPTRDTWEPGPLAPLASTHSCVSAYWVAGEAIERVADLYDESLSSIPQADRTARRVPRSSRGVRSRRLS